MMPNRGTRIAIVLGAVALVGLPLASEAQPALRADLALTVPAPPSTPVGSSLTFELAVSNAGPDTEPEAALEVALPDGLALASVEPERGACDGGPPATCSLGAIGPGEVARVAVTASPVDAGHLEGIATVSGTAAQAGGEPDEATIRVEATGQPCTVVGTEGDDELEGTEGPDVICGLGGDDLLRGLAGNDELLGGSGEDTADFSPSGWGVRVSLLTGTSQGDGMDVLAEVEHAIGSSSGDLLEGSAVANTLEGLGGDDVLLGYGDGDRLEGGDGGDYLHGGGGSDAIDGGLGSDTCLVGPDGGATTACEATPNPRDPRDTRGPLDLRRVRGPVGGSRPTWTLKTRSRWTPRGVWDQGYLVVWLDARGGPEPDHLAVIRSTGRGLLGRLFRVNAGGRERQVGNVRAWKRGKRGAAVRVAFHKVRVGSARFAYRWGAQTMFTGRRCARVCFDLVPGRVEMFLQPLPGG